MMTWSLVLRTMNRPEVLLECIRLATNQTLPPAEVIVVDAGDVFEDSARAAQAAVDASAAAARLIYTQARVRSMTHQHDQGIRLATSDVVFLIDDDSLMYPDAAEHVMRVYQSAPYGAISAVGLSEVHVSPQQAAAFATPCYARQPGLRSTSIVGQLRRRFDRVHHNFLPYQGWQPPAVMSESTDELSRGVSYLKGFQMTALREHAIRSPPTLSIYSGIHEDIDFSYRLSALGAVRISKFGRVFHGMVSTGRRSRRTHGLFKSLNMAILTRLHGGNPSRLRWFLFKRMVLEFSSDLCGRRLSFPQFRGSVAGWRLSRMLKGVPDSELDAWSCRVSRDEMQMSQRGDAAGSKKFA